MFAALLLLQAAPQTAPQSAPQSAVDAERAFYRAAQTQGQWKAFRDFSTPDAVVFTPQPEKVDTALPTKEPPVAVQWWPADSYVSCDGTVAVNTGPWVRPRSFGYFTTVWEKQSDASWKWLVDSGDALAKPRLLPEKPRIHRASCANRPKQAPPPRGVQTALTLVGTPATPGFKSALGTSRDETLRWTWSVRPDGARNLSVEFWNGRDFKIVLHDEIAAPKP